MWQPILDSSWFIFLFCTLLFLSIGDGVLYAIHYKKKYKWETSGIENAV
jgi:hypothetical protein